MENLERIFVNKNELPQNFLPKPFPFKQTKYLIDGKIGEWSGPFTEVYSPIFWQSEGKFENRIGAYPKMGADEAMMALDAAVRAYNHGSGPLCGWRTE